jgi:Helicase HerA, central domain/Bacterial protein of unknown function (DUF853)
MSESRGLYLGREVDAATRAGGARVDLDPHDLLTHGLIVGMTGSGKTGLGIVLIEEVLRQGVPVIAIDPKGDLGNLMLLFDDLSPASFASWIDPEVARRKGQTPEAAGAEAAAAWKSGLEPWGLGAADIAALHAKRDAVIFTPGSTAGTPLNILQSLDAPAVPFDSIAEDLRDEIAGIVSGLLALLGIDADPLRSREFVLLSNIVETSWRAGKGLTLESLIAAVADPPFQTLGALPLATFFPPRDRQALLMALNSLAASPSFGTWRQGEPLDVERMLKTPDGRPRLSIVYTAHLSDAERLFVTALLLDKVKTWMRRQSGTSELRALVYMDEIFGYFPPTANPPTKRPLLTLVKQARAQGVGIVLATQNPVDLDYKALANLGTWMIGKLQTDRDRERLRDGLAGSGADMPTMERLLDAAAPRTFLLHDIHRAKPILLQSRWAMSYLRGPLTREELGRLRGETPAATAPAEKRPAAGAAPPVLPEPLDHLYYSRYGGELADPHLLVKYALRRKGEAEIIASVGYPLTGTEVSEMLEGEAVAIEEPKLQTAAPTGVRYGDLPSFVTSAGGKGIEKRLKERLADKLAATILEDPVTKTLSTPGETREAFVARLEAAAGGAAGAKVRDKLDKKKRELAVKEQELSGRKTEKWAAIGGAILSNIGLFTGKKRTISGASGVLSKNRMENTAEGQVDALKAEIAALEEELAATASIDPTRLVEKTLVPSRNDVKVLRYDIVWIY